MEYAIIENGGKQYTVKIGDIVLLEKIEQNEGDSVKLNNVLLLKNDTETKIGEPFIKGASVNAVVVKQTRGKKLIIFKKLRCRLSICTPPFV